MSALDWIEDPTDAPPAPAPQMSDSLRDLVGRMKADGLVTQRRDGRLELRSYGREALAVLQTIDSQEGS